MDRRMALMISATALVAAACSSGSKGGTTALPSIAGVSPTAAATTAAASSSPSDASTSEASSAPATKSASPSGSPSSSASASASASQSAQAGGGCASSNLELSLGESQGAAGSQIAPLSFINLGPTSCTLGGYPGVSFVTGDKGTQVGAAGVKSGPAGGTINLAPKQAAQSLIKIANTDNYPTATCKPVTVRGLRVYPPGQTAALFVALPDTPDICSGTGVGSQLSVQSVAAAS